MKKRATTAGVPRRPICEECDQEMHEFDGEGVSGWSCDGCGWSFDNEDEDDTSTEAHMSKVEVKVKKGDLWYTTSGMLHQHRGDRARLVADQIFMQDSDKWTPILNRSNPIPSNVARAWIESLGGTVVEEREEEKAAKVVAHVRTDTGAVFLSIEGSDQHKYDEKLYKRIHIAGVTT